MEQDDREDAKMIEGIIIVDIDPNLASFRPIQQKWVTSLQFLTEELKQLKSNQKIVSITNGLFLVIGFCQKNKPPIYEIDFITNPTSDWINVRLPQDFAALLGSSLCYKIQEVQLAGPLADVDLLGIQRKSKFGEDKEVITVPHGYHMVNNPIAHNFLIYRKVRSRLEQTFKPILLEKYPSQINKINPSLLPIFCFPQGIRLSRQIKGFITLNFILTLQTAQRIYCTCLVFKQNLNELYKTKLNLKSVDKIYNQKAICVISKYCYTDQFSQCLQHLYRLSMSRNDLPFYKVAQNFVDCMKMTKEIGNLGISYSYGGSNILFQTNLEYPIVSEKSIYCIFKFLHIETIVTVFEAIMLERKVFFVSQSKTLLGYAAEAFTALLFPFKWEQTIIPILPTTLKDYIAAPLPLIAGISPMLVDSSIETESIIVFLDKNQILNEQTLPPLPEKLQKQLLKRLSQFEVYVQEEVREYLQNPENTYIFKMQQVQNPHFKGHIIRDIFFQFMLTLMKNYKKYWKKPITLQPKQTSSIGFSTEPQLMNDMFKTQQFLSDLGMTKIGSFGYKFTQSSIFTAFIQKKYQNPLDVQIDFFDKCIEIKKNKKDTIFINAIKNIKYTVAQHPQIEGNGKNTYIYQKFPSILSLNQVSQEDINLTIPDFLQQQQRLQQIVHQEFAINQHLYQPAKQKLKDQLYDKMMGLLIKKYKNQFPENQNIRLNVLNWFYQVYTQQLDQVSQLLNKWPKFSNSITFISIRKKQYFLKKGEKFISKGEILGIHQNQDYEMLIYDDQKILLGPYKAYMNSQKKTYFLEVPSFKIKHLLNNIIPKQALWLFRFINEHRNYSQWSIETMIDFREWICENKDK